MSGKIFEIYSCLLYQDMATLKEEANTTMNSKDTKLNDT